MLHFNVAETFTLNMALMGTLRRNFGSCMLWMSRCSCMCRQARGEETEELGHVGYDLKLAPEAWPWCISLNISWSWGKYAYR